LAISGFIYDIFDNLPYLIGKYRDLPALLLLPCAAVFLAIMARRITPLARGLAATAVILAAGVILTMLWTSTAYLTATGYLDHVEPSIAAVSWWYHGGHPLYPAWNDGQGVYGFVYGPLLFQVTAAAMSFEPSILVSKLPGFCAFWLACGATAWALRPSLPSAAQSLLPVAVLILIAGGYWRAAYWVRGDPDLVLFAALALFSYRRLDRTAAAIVIGLLAGGIMNLKIHGALYVLPYAVALVAAAPSAASRARTAAIGVGCGVLALILPFLDPNVSVVNYLAFLNATLHHGLDRSLLLLNVRLTAVLVLPALFLVWRHVRGQKQPELLMALVYCASVLAVCVIGGKKGAGPTHLLPFLPAFIFFVMRAAQPQLTPKEPTTRPAALAVYFLVLAIAFLPSFISNLFSLRAWDRANDDPAFRQEATQFYADYPTAAMGAAGDESYGMTQYKAIGVLAGGPLVFDATTWMDLQKGGVPDEVTQRLLLDCRTPFWIIPNGGAPFTQTAAYDPDPLFSDRFRELFHQEYKPIRNGKYYSVWGCRDVGPNH
jgi:hypothetical protein